MQTGKTWTVMLYRAPHWATNEWNDFKGVDWPSMVRGNFVDTNDDGIAITGYERACLWASMHLRSGAPFTITEVPQ